MTVVQINATCERGSTGRICISLSDLMQREGIRNYIIHSDTSSRANAVSFSDKLYIKLQALKARIFGNWGFNSYRATVKIIKALDRLSPDIVHLHNIHGHDCNLGALLPYLAEKHIKVVWTFHDCWAFTGYCTHFDAARCDKWKRGCGNCPQRRKYTWFFDRSRELWERKRKLTEALDLTLVAPSLWMAELIGESFMSSHPVYVINNGIDLSVFAPKKSDFREKHGLTGKYMLLGSALYWSNAKGLDVFAELSKRLGDEYRTVLVGTDTVAESLLPKDIISIPKTADRNLLAEIYSAADLFINPTREDTFPTVNVEALACGTPVLTFRTGGSPEIINEACGVAVPKDDTDAMASMTVHICENRPYSEDACLLRAREFDEKDKFGEYISLYKEIYDRAPKN